MPLFILVLIWSIVAIILKLSAVGAFASWDITAWPWHWSCCCILWLYLCFVALVVAIVTAVRVYAYWRKERIINSYVPEQRDFIRRMMNGDNR